MNNLSATVKMLRKQYKLTQEELSLKSVWGYRQANICMMIY